MDCNNDVIMYSLLALASLLIFLYFYITSSYNHWKDRGVPYIKPSFPFGNLGDVVLGKKSLIDLTIEQYREFEGERFFGIFNYSRPALVLRDVSLIEKILMTDFGSFCNRVDDSPVESDDLLAYYLGNLQGDMWRKLRQKLNGAFSHSKLKRMMEQISLCGDRLVKKIAESESDKEPVMADCLGFLFSQQVIASCAFGIECEGLSMVSFIQHAKKYLWNMKVVHLIILGYMYLPRLTRFLYLVPPVAKVVEYFRNLTEATIQLRQVTPGKRNDFLQILIDIREEEATENDKYKHPDFMDGKETEENITKIQTNKFSPSERELILSNRCITSQLFIFLSLGMEMSAVAIAFLMCDLSLHPDVQRRVQEEVDQVVEKFGELSYEALQHLEYLDSVIQESARMRPGFPYIMRVCSTPYRIQDSDLVLEKGSTILIPSFALQLDPSHYPDPETFNPDRFSDNRFKPSATFLAYGAGPRMCIAFKLIILELKLAIAKVMLNFSVKLHPKTELPLQYAPQFMPKLLSGVWVNFESRKPPTK